MKNFILKISGLLLLAFSCLNLPSSAKVEPDLALSSNGEWQYVIRRMDANAVGGSLPAPQDCPLYIGYFHLDFKPLKPDKKGRYIYKVYKGEKGIFNGVGGKKYVIGAKSYEMKGSYTPVDANEYCKKPLTQITGEKAPIFMRKIANNGKKLEWDTDFAAGSKAQNAIWQVKADYDGKNTMRGTLKAYVCAGNNGERKSCKLLNTAKFFAQKIQSIEEAAGKPLFSKIITVSPLDKFMQDLQNLIKGEEKQNIISEGLYSKEEQGLLTKYIKPSLAAALPSWAAGTYGLKVCTDKGGVSGGTDSNGNPICKVCTPVNCQPGETPSGEIEGDCYASEGEGHLCKAHCWTTSAGKGGTCI